jgi:transcriptional antiterminator NusG
VRNTRGVTGFVGPGSKPVPLTDEEVENMGIEQQQIILNYAEGDSVKIKFGPLSDFVGIVDEISMEKKKVRVVVSMFGRETPVELEFNQVEVV